MKQFPVKAVSAAMAASMMLSVAACSRAGGSASGLAQGNGVQGDGVVSMNSGSRSGEKITADTPWFDSEIFDAVGGTDPNKPVEYMYHRLAGSDKDNLIVYVNGYYRFPDNVNWDTVDYSKYSINMISVIDRNTKQTVNNIDINDKIGANDYIDNVEYADGKLTAKVTTWDDKTFSQTSKKMVFDVKTGEVVDTIPVKDEANGGYERSFKLGDYEVSTIIGWDESDSAYYTLVVTSPDGSSRNVELKDKSKSYYDIPVVLSLDENTALIPASTSNGFTYFEMDLKEAKLTPANDKDYDWLDLDSCYSSYTAPDGTVYYTSPLGIVKIDLKNKQTVQYLNYSWSDVNRNILSYLEIADISDDKILLCGENYNYSAYKSESDSQFVIVELTRAASNPHAGKTILELYSPYGYTEDKIADAILKYNDQSTEYFIEVSDRYTSLDDSDYSNVNSEDESNKISLEADSKMGNQLSVDIMNGEGPDILMNASYYGQLNNPSYLADLTPYLGNLDSAKYFTNVIEAAKVDGKLYNLPVCFYVEGIQTDSKYAGASGIGFTTDEYAKFVKETMNGKDLIESGQAYYFAKLFDSMSDKFIVNGKADFTGPEFEALAEYCKNNVIASSKSWDEMYGDGPMTDVSYGVGATVFKGDRGYDENSPAYYTYCYGMSNYLTMITDLKGGSAILGLPSADGRGPAVAPYISVAVSAQAYNVDACGEFVKLLMSDDVQLDFAMKDNFVLSREAFREAGKAAVEYYDSDQYYYDYYGSLDTPEAKNRIRFSEKNIDDMEAIIESCSKMKSTDADISLILIEEMPSYFSGQKDLQSVIAIAQDRVQKVLNERG